VEARRELLEEDREAERDGAHAAAAASQD